MELNILRASPSPGTAGLAAGEATLFRLAGLSAGPVSMLQEEEERIFKISPEIAKQHCFFSLKARKNHSCSSQQ